MSNPDDTRRPLLRTFVVQLAATTKICPQWGQNAAATKHATNVASGVTQTMMLFQLLECYYQVLLLMSVRKKANKCKRSIWSRRWIEQHEKHGAYHSVITKWKVKNNNWPISAQRFPQLVAQIRAGCYSDLGCTTCCTTQQQSMTDVQQKFSSKVAQQKSAIKVYVCHQGKMKWWVSESIKHRMRM